MARGDGEAVELHPAALLRRDGDPQDLVGAGREIDGTSDVSVVRKLDLETRSAAVIAHGEPKLGPLPCEDRVSPDEAQLRPEKVVVAVVHQHDAQAGEQEGEHEAEARAVVQRAEQHREHHHREDRAEASRQDVDAAPS